MARGSRDLADRCTKLIYENSRRVDQRDPTCDDAAIHPYPHRPAGRNPQPVPGPRRVTMRMAKPNRSWTSWDMSPAARSIGSPTWSGTVLPHTPRESSTTTALPAGQRRDPTAHEFRTPTATRSPSAAPDHRDHVTIPSPRRSRGRRKPVGYQPADDSRWSRSRLPARTGVTWHAGRCDRRTRHGPGPAGAIRMASSHHLPLLLPRKPLDGR